MLSLSSSARERIKEVKMKEKMWEDMFTPEGVPMTSPFDCGMEGSQNWMYDREKYRRENMKGSNKTPAMAYHMA